MFGFGMGWSMWLGLLALALIAYAIYYAVTSSTRKQDLQNIKVKEHWRYSKRGMQEEKLQGNST